VPKGAIPAEVPLAHGLEPDEQHRAAKALNNPGYPAVVRPYLIVPANSLLAGTNGASVWLDPGGSVRQLLGARESALAVVRPDGYLGYRGQPAAWEGLRAYLDRYLIARSG
jgi:hypothetical protein